jgi:hypothetical protein
MIASADVHPGVGISRANTLVVGNAAIPDQAL